MIVSFYIELVGDQTQAVLEKLLGDNNFAFYDATAFDPYTQSCVDFPTLEDIEIYLEAK